MLPPIIRNACNNMTAVMQAYPYSTRGLLASYLVLVTCEAITSRSLHSKAAFSLNRQSGIELVTFYQMMQYHAAYPFIACQFFSHRGRFSKAAIGIGYILPEIIVFGNVLLKQRAGKIALASLSIAAKLVSSVALGLFASSYRSPRASSVVGISCFALSMFTAYKTWR